MFESISYSNVYVRYERLFECSKRQLFKYFSQFIIVILNICKETYILLESPFYSEWNGLCPISIY